MSDLNRFLGFQKFNVLGHCTSIGRNVQNQGYDLGVIHIVHCWMSLMNLEYSIFIKRVTKGIIVIN